MAARDVVESEFALLLKRFDRIGFGRRGVLDAEAQGDLWHSTAGPESRVVVEELVDAHLAHATAAAAAEPLGYTRAEDVQALCVNLLARWRRPGLLARLDALEAAGEFTIEGKIPESLQVALDEARTTVDR